MKKEIIIAIIVGFVIGLIITFGIYQAQKSYVEEVVSPEPTPTPVNLPTPDPNVHTLDLVAPEDFAINETGVVVATGFTTPLSYITATTAESESLTQATETGSFTIEVEIPEGASEILFSAIAPDGTKSTISRTISFFNASDEEESSQVSENEEEEE